MPGHEYIPLVEHLTGFFGSFFDQLRDAESTVLEWRELTAGARTQDAFEQLIMQPVVMVDYKDLSAVLTDLGERLKSHPGALLGCLGMAATLVAMTHLRQDDYFDPVYDRKIVRIVGHPVVTPLKDLKSNLMGKFISIRGTVVRVSSVKPMTTQMAFLCTKCERTQVQVLVDGKFRAPIKCTTFGCRGKTFVADRSTDSPTHTIDWQRIRVQEKLADDQVDSGRIPRTVECELVQDLVDGVVPGDVVSVSGIVKVLSTDESKKKQSSQMYYLYIDTNSLSKAGGSSADQEESRSDGRTGLSKDYLHFSRKELYGIREIHEQPDVFRLLVHSLCPPIYGHEIVKGDPGLGKSQMLSATVRAAPRGVYVCGNTTTTSGLTVTICKDADSGDTALEAGALVLGDQGVCCIDEFDKMVEHQALLEAMEQQSISIAKAGIVCSLPARTSVIAAANPVGGHYKLSPGSQSTIRVVIQKLMTRSSKAKTVSENLKMNGALLSRFDLVFILLDKPDERMDMFLSDHIMKRLRVGRDEVLHPIPLPLLRKYIAYARTYTKPRLTKEAALVLQRFYLTLRRQAPDRHSRCCKRH
nr:DNA replication licensing factor mcm8 [Polyrhizophydium stewartii]